MTRRASRTRAPIIDADGIEAIPAGMLTLPGDDQLIASLTTIRDDRTAAVVTHLKGRYVVDMQTANALLTVYTALKPANQATFPSKNLPALVNFAWSQVTFTAQRA